MRLRRLLVLKQKVAHQFGQRDVLRREPLGQGVGRQSGENLERKILSLPSSQDGPAKILKKCIHRVIDSARPPTSAPSLDYDAAARRRSQSQKMVVFPDTQGDEGRSSALANVLSSSL